MRMGVRCRVSGAGLERVVKNREAVNEKQKLSLGLI